MGRLIKPKIDQIFRTKIVELTKDLALRSKCIVISETNTICPNCVYDPTLKASSGKYKAGGPQPFTGKTCPVCSSKGRITASTRLQIPANVRWGAKHPMPDVPMPEGEVPVGYARIKAEVKYYDLMYNAAYFEIDGIRCKNFDKPRKRGLQSYVITEMLVQIDK